MDDKRARGASNGETLPSQRSVPRGRQDIGLIGVIDRRCYSVCARYLCSSGRWPRRGFGGAERVVSLRLDIGTRGRALPLGFDQWRFGPGRYSILRFDMCSLFLVQWYTFTMPVLLARLGVTAVLLLAFLPVSLERRFLPKISWASASCSLLCLSARQLTSAVWACSGSIVGHYLPRLMISSKLTAGFAALIFGTAAQVENPATSGGGAGGISIGAYTKTVQFVPGSFKTTFHFEIQYLAS
jgi:hypothetical protein